ncbi:hypothetical protein ACO1O0_001429 [Amphichorda felina]
MSKMSGTASKKSRGLSSDGMRNSPRLPNDRLAAGDVPVDTKWFTRGFSNKSMVGQGNSQRTTSPARWGNVHIESPTETAKATEYSTRNGNLLGSKNGHRESPIELTQPPKANPRGVKPATIEKQGTVEKQAGMDAPLASPLHIIESAIPQSHIHPRKTKRSTGEWSISDLSSFDDGQEGERDAQGTEVAVSPVESSSARQAERDANESNPAFVWAWRDRTTLPTLEKDPVEEFKDNPLSHEYEVDTSTGDILPKNESPVTIMVDEPGVDPDMVYKRVNMTSTLHIMRERKIREKLASTIRMQQEMDRERELALTREPEPEWPSTDCTLRPATAAHFNQIADIINLESRQGVCPQALDSKETSARDVCHLFEHCQRNLRPFIVACLEGGDLLDRSKWPGVSEREYLEYVRFKQSQQAKPPEVVGFAFVAEPRIGFLNRPCPGSRFAGQIRLIVHPKHRQKGYGTALLDRILLSVAPYHHSLINYEWRCVDPGTVYEQPSAAHNRRLYSKVLAEVFSRKDAKAPWKHKMLEKFCFKQVACLEDMVRTDRGDESQWLDLELWQLQTTARIIDDAPGEYLTP